MECLWVCCHKSSVLIRKATARHSQLRTKLIVKQVCSKLDSKHLQVDLKFILFTLKDYQNNLGLFLIFSLKYWREWKEDEKWKTKREKIKLKRISNHMFKVAAKERKKHFQFYSWTFSHQTLQNLQHMRDKYRAAAISWRFILLRSAHSRQWFRWVQFFLLLKWIIQKKKKLFV